MTPATLEHTYVMLLVAGIASTMYPIMMIGLKLVNEREEE